MKFLIKLILLISIIIFTGCGGEKKIVKNEEQNPLITGEKVIIYNVDLDKLLNTSDIYKKLHEFPFISEEANLDFKGHFPIEFYQSFNYPIRAKELRNVDFWKLRMYPYSLDIIYVKPIWLEDFKYASNDLFEDICYTFNLSKKEQYILDWWIRNGGVLWVESGIYATGFENINKDGTINIKAITHRILNLVSNLHFIQYPVSTITYISHKKSLTATTRETIIFNNLKSNLPIFNEIHHLEIKLKYPIQTFFYIPKNKGAIQDKYGRNIVNIINYGKGKIIFLFPFEYTDAYKDGELLRWRLIQYIYSHTESPEKGRKVPKIKYKKKNSKKRDSKNYSI